MTFAHNNRKFTRTAARRGSVLAAGLALALGAIAPVSRAQTADRVTVPSGTLVDVKIDTPIGSRSARPGDPVKATVLAPVEVSNLEAIPTGTAITGRVTDVVANRSWGTSSGVSIAFDRMTSPSGVSLNVDGDLMAPDGSPMTTVDNLERGAVLRFRLSESVVVTRAFAGWDEGFQSTVKVVSASASTRAGQMFVRIVAQNTNALRMTETHRRQADTMHIYVTGTRSGFIRGMNEIIVTLDASEWRGLNRIVVHSLGNDIVIRSEEVGRRTITPAEAQAIETDATTLLADYARVLGVRYNRWTGAVSFTAQNYRENEVELLFALNSLASTSKLFTQLVRTSNDGQAIDGACDLMVEQARGVDRAAGRTRSQRAEPFILRWKQMRGDIMELDSGNGPSAWPQ